MSTPQATSSPTKNTATSSKKATSPAIEKNKTKVTTAPKNPSAPTNEAGPASKPGRSKSPKKVNARAKSEDVSSAPRYGRRAEGDGGSGTTAKAAVTASTAARPKDEVAKNVPTLADDGSAMEAEVLRRRAEEERTKLKDKLAAAPTGYQAIMPRLTDLDITTNWDKLLTTIHTEFDMSCLTTCLARELDEDIPWNPEMLLVQLTSDLHDAAELNDKDAAFVPVDEADIGLMSGGEVIRRRKEKGAAGAQEDDSPTPPVAAQSDKGQPLFSKRPPVAAGAAGSKEGDGPIAPLSAKDGTTSGGRVAKGVAEIEKRSKVVSPQKDDKTKEKKIKEKGSKK